MNLLAQAEASRVYDTILSRRENLRDEHASSVPPWSNNQFTEVSIRASIDRIVKGASAPTAALYNRGKPNGENWVVKWMLYHVCRYRDSRNKKARGKNFHDDDEMFGPPSKWSIEKDAAE